VSTLHGMGVGSTADPSLDLGGDDLIQDALHGMGAGSAVDPYVAAPMPSILGDDSSKSKGEDIGGGGGARPPSNVEVSSVSCCHTTDIPLLEELEDDVEAHFPALLQSVGSRPRCHALMRVPLMPS
jgi:hypothetical protein